jgi:LPXTG-motif cell wall-anchored protein
MKRIATVTFTRMAKRLLVLMAVLAAMLAAAVPVFAQGQVSATGVLLDGLPADVATNGTHSITDQASGTVYALESEAVDLDAYVGQEVTVYGTLTPGEASSDETGFEGNGTLPSIDVTRVEPADGPIPDPTTDMSATFNFELTVKGEPPAGARFFGAVPAEGCISVPLTDPDGDGLYTGSLDVPRFAPGPLPPPGAEPVSLPVRIVQADGGAGPCNPTRVIKDFGVVPADDDTFKARVNFKGGPVSPEEPTDECLAVSENPEECEDYVAPGGSGSGSGGSGDSGSGGSGSDGGSSASDGGSGGGGSNSGSSDSNSSGNGAESSGLPGGVTDGIRGILPSTGGGMALWVLGAGILLIGGGLLILRIFR